MTRYFQYIKPAGRLFGSVAGSGGYIGLQEIPGGTAADKFHIGRCRLSERQHRCRGTQQRLFVCYLISEHIRRFRFSGLVYTGLYGDELKNQIARSHLPDPVWRRGQQHQYDGYQLLVDLIQPAVCGEPGDRRA